jgi:hypothetical protein
MNHLGRIFGQKRCEVTEGTERLHNEELHNLYSSPIIIRIMKPRRMRWSGQLARMAENKTAYRVFVGKKEGKRSLGRHIRT